MTIKQFIECAAPNMRVGIMNGCDFIGVYDDAHDIPREYHAADVWRVDVVEDYGRIYIELTIYL